MTLRQLFSPQEKFSLVLNADESHSRAMGSCLGVIFAFIIFIATGVTLVYQWNTNSSLKFERVGNEPVEQVING